MVARSCGVGERKWVKQGEREQEVQISSYKINKSQGCGVQHREYVNTIITLYGDT